MTRDEIMQMPAGPKMDLAVAERFMGERPARPYSTWLDFAGRVLDKLREKFWVKIQLPVSSRSEDDKIEIVALYSGIGVPTCSCYHSLADTLPLAICRAALLVAEGNGK